MFKTKGFTLIELMIIVGIISALAAIFVPAYLEYAEEQQEARESVTRIEKKVRPGPVEVLKPTVAPDITPGYVDGLRIDHKPMVLRRHSLSGVLYACDLPNNRCYKVEE